MRSHRLKCILVSSEGMVFVKGKMIHLDRHERKFAEDRAPYKSEARRDGFSSRVRYGSGEGRGNSNYRGRDKFNGRQGCHPIKTRTEKWSHDLYHEVNKDPIPKSEDDQIAKIKLANQEKFNKEAGEYYSCPAAQSKLQAELFHASLKFEVVKLKWEEHTE